MTELYKHKVRRLNGIVDKLRGAICNLAKENNNYMKKKKKKKSGGICIFGQSSPSTDIQLSITSNLLSSHKDSK